jgi:hypothetical protein
MVNIVHVLTALHFTSLYIAFIGLSLVNDLGLKARRAAFMIKISSFTMEHVLNERFESLTSCKTFTT